MFSYDGVKEQYDPFNALLNPDCTFQHCVTSFYDHDSDHNLADISTPQCSVTEVIAFLGQLTDIATTPLEDLLKIVRTNSAFTNVDLHILRRQIVREKNRVKRQKAKNRPPKFFMTTDRQMPVYMPVNDEQDEQFKKQRNRISAQISRDRKKQKVKALEELNRKLQEECRQQREQNQRLRREAREATEKGNKALDAVKSPFTRLLIFLGVFFLFALIKDILGTSESTKTIAKIQQQTKDIFLSESKEYGQSFAEFNPQESLKLLEDRLTEGIPNKGVGGRLKEGLRQRVAGWIGDGVWQTAFKGLTRSPVSQMIKQ